MYSWASYIQCHSAITLDLQNLNFRHLNLWSTLPIFPYNSFQFPEFSNFKTTPKSIYLITLSLFISSLISSLLLKLSLLHVLSLSFPCIYFQILCSQSLPIIATTVLISNIRIRFAYFCTVSGFFHSMLRFIHAITYISSSFFFYCWVMFHCKIIPWFVYPFSYWWTLGCSNLGY